MLSGRHSSQAISPKVSAGFNTVRDTPERGHCCPHRPTRAPSALARANPLPAQPHGCFASQQVGKHRHQHRCQTPCPPSRLPVPGLAHLLLLIPRARATQEAPLHPTEREKKTGYKKGRGTALRLLHLGGLTTTFPISSLHPLWLQTISPPATRLQPPRSPPGSG